MKGYKTMFTESQNAQSSNVLALFGDQEIGIDPLQTLLDEAQTEAFLEEESEDLETNLKRPAVVNVLGNPDQSMYLLENQLEALKDRMGRLNFYLNGVQDILPLS